MLTCPNMVTQNPITRRSKVMLFIHLVNYSDCPNICFWHPDKASLLYRLTNRVSCKKSIFLIGFSSWLFNRFIAMLNILPLHDALCVWKHVKHGKYRCCLVCSNLPSAQNLIARKGGTRTCYRNTSTILQDHKKKAALKSYN